MRNYTIELMCVEQVIETEIKNGACLTEIAKTYAMGLRSSWNTDWAKVDEMIVKRWSKSGLARVKKMAWSGSCFDKPKSPLGERSNNAREGQKERGR